jgi:hypothetical protein
MGALAGTPSDDIPGVLATGRSGVTNMFVSMSARHPEGRDAEYLRWHCFDHRPEQYRLASIRGSLRLVSTPECRGARAACDARYDAVDHVMTYFFTDLAALEPFNDLAVALRSGDRIPYLLPMVERAVYGVDGVAAAPRVKVGADVLPWWPAEGGYVLLERGGARGDDLLEVDGVGGAWWGRNVRVDELYASGQADMQITYCFLDDDPVTVAERLRPALEMRWASGVEPLFAAPFHVVLSHDLARHLP